MKKIAVCVGAVLCMSAPVANAKAIIPFAQDKPLNINTVGQVVLVERISSSTPTLTEAKLACDEDGNATCSEEEVRALFKQPTVNIKVNHDNACVHGATTGCTSLAGIHPEVIQQLLDLKRKCDCSIEVTGGTEAHTAGRESHANGYKVDLNFVVDSKLNKYIIDTCPTTDTCTFNHREVTEPRYTYTQNGTVVEYVDESAGGTKQHWDVKVTQVKEQPEIDMRIDTAMLNTGTSWWERFSSFFKKLFTK